MLGPSTVQLHERVDDLRDARARIIAAGDAERRRIERDLHDGAQQRLVALSLTLGMAESRLATDPDAAAPLIAQAREEAPLAVKELRELASGIHPALLTERGLGPALEALAAARAGPHDGRRRARAPAPAAGRVDRLLRHRGGADQRRQVRGRHVAPTSRSRSSTAGLLLIIRDDGAGGADLDDRQRPARPARPRRGARRPAPHRLPARPRHDADRRDPARRPAMRRLALAAALAVARSPAAAAAPKVDPDARRRRRRPGSRSPASVDVEVVPGDSGEVVVTAGEDVIDRVHDRGRGRRAAHRIKRPRDRHRPRPVRRRARAGLRGRARHVRVEGSGRPPARPASTADELDDRVEGAADIEASGTVDTLTAEHRGRRRRRPRRARGPHRARDVQRGRRELNVATSSSPCRAPATYVSRNPTCGSASRARVRCGRRTDSAARRPTALGRAARRRMPCDGAPIATCSAGRSALPQFEVRRLTTAARSKTRAASSVGVAEALTRPRAAPSRRCAGSGA